MKLLKRKPNTCFGISVFCILILFGCIGYGFWQINLDHENSIRVTSKRLNLPPNEDTIKNFVYCDLILSGDNLPEVESNLLMVDKFHVYGEGKMKRYEFDDPNIAYLLGEIHLTYDNNWVLIEKGKQAGFGDYSQFVCDTKSN